MFVGDASPAVILGRRWGGAQAGWGVAEWSRSAVRANIRQRAWDLYAYLVQLRRLSAEAGLQCLDKTFFPAFSAMLCLDFETVLESLCYRRMPTSIRMLPPSCLPRTDSQRTRAIRFCALYRYASPFLFLSQYSSRWLANVVFRYHCSIICCRAKRKKSICSDETPNAVWMLLVAIQQRNCISVQPPPNPHRLLIKRGAFSPGEKTGTRILTCN
ncbi:hypothetical protein DFH06DRAFT_572756 [Mycena polygramma]|nr:hypothetical protein DFH06DRAFT_572756 [Mycena polygramma]